MKKKLAQLSLLAILVIFMTSCVQPQNETTENAPQAETEVEELVLEFRDFGNEPFVFNIEDYTRGNDTYRTALWTGEFMQLTVMSILPGENIGLEVHMDHDQFIRVEEGEGIVKMGDTEDDLTFEERVEDVFAIMIPAGKWHNVINDSNKPLKLYSIYAPREHKQNTVHKTRAEAMADEHDH